MLNVSVYCCEKFYLNKYLYSKSCLFLFQQEQGGGKKKSKGKSKEKGKGKSVSGVPMCLPVCCAMPCSIM